MDQPQPELSLDVRCAPSACSCNLCHICCMISHCDPLKPFWLHLQGMQVVLLALIRSMPSVAGVVAFGMFEYLVFAIMGVQLFSGKLGSCNSAVSLMPLDPAQCHHGVQSCCSKHAPCIAAVGSLHVAFQRVQLLSGKLSSCHAVESHTGLHISIMQVKLFLSNLGSRCAAVTLICLGSLKVSLMLCPHRCLQPSTSLLQQETFLRPHWLTCCQPGESSPEALHGPAGLY